MASSAFNLLNHELFQLIKAEHQLCDEKIKLAKTITDKKNLLDWLYTEIETKHHIKEEKIIFPILFTKPGLKEGGPYCVLYFDEHLMNPPLNQFKSVTKTNPTHLEHESFYQTNPSSLDIPMEEHVCLRNYIQYLIQNKSTLTDSEFEKVFFIYTQLLEKHTRKEEKCFFVVCANSLTKEELDLMAEKWKADLF